MQEAQIIRYTRNRKGQLNGCMVAAKIGDEIRFGYSLCNKVDLFDKKFAKQLATERMNKWPSVKVLCRLPDSMRNEYNHFQDRMTRYFRVK